MAAYQGTYEYWFADPSPRKAPGLPPTVVGLPEIGSDGAITWLEKARGPGDCGDYYVFTLSGDAWSEKEHRRRACSDDASEVPPPTSWPLITNPCAPGDQPLMQCDATNGKNVAVCGSAGRLQYRFGAVGAPELVFPPDANPRAFQFKYETTVRSERNILEFTNDGYVYDITDAIGGGGTDDAEYNNFQGVEVWKDGKVVATVSCAGMLDPDWDRIKATIGP